MNTTFSIGDLTIHRIVEMEIPFTDPYEFIPGLTPAVLEANHLWMQDAGALDPATGKLVLCFQSYVVRTPHHTILIDSCVGNDKDRTGRPVWHMKKDDAWMRGLAAAGLTVDDIDVVMCTHLHVDHVGWNTRLENGRWVPTFPRARYLFSEREYAHWAGLHAKTPIACIADSVIPIVEAKRADFVSSSHAVNDHVRLIPTPGHTPDHFAVELGRGETAAIVTGDLIHSPLQARYPALSMRADSDPDQAAATRRSFLERACEGRTLCCTAHFPSPSLARFTRWGNGFRCEAG
ncbi:MAG: MBL fold metallo-hydrolase [Rhodospirillales bacterium]|jgi:glyoxylase-like metal-dependent hydrolase (beta-lactamase superfamily II)|nr:MBL fold metallo-hydrolase [Rhodospirillales bacterium]